MKILKLFIFLAFCTVGTDFVHGQEISNHAIGLRLGESDGYGAEISYQKSIGRYNRLEIDLGWRDSREYDAFKVAVLYHWVRPIDGGLQWYYGFGGGLGDANFELTLRDNEAFQPDGGFFVFAAGTVGIEYSFDFPLLLSLDLRPELGLIGYGDFDNNLDFDIGLGVRYQF
ncbi:hypothetical protein [Maribacter sp. 2-571]|uniref:hypothetical protein n=1 Tax=Maribacter sp. 2-571 TaxID=3417569 RepID=UPI003D33E895